jgi:hypothetical protein
VLTTLNGHSGPRSAQFVPVCLTVGETARPRQRPADFLAPGETELGERADEPQAADERVDENREDDDEYGRHRSDRAGVLTNEPAAEGARQLEQDARRRGMHDAPSWSRGPAPLEPSVRPSCEQEGARDKAHEEAHRTMPIARRTPSAVAESAAAAVA